MQLLQCLHNCFCTFLIERFFSTSHYSRTPGSRQPSPAEETLPRPPTLLDPSQHSAFPQMPHFNHMLMDHGQGHGMGGGAGSALGGVGNNSSGGNAAAAYAHQQMAAQMSQLQPPMMNGVGAGMPMAAQVSHTV